MTARWITADVFDGLATLDDGSVDLVVTSPPFLRVRSYLPDDHPGKSKELGQERNPSEFIDNLLLVTAELRRVLASHGSIAVELGEKMAGSGGAGGDYNADGLRAGQPKFGRVSGDDWPLPKSMSMIPQLYEIALAYGINPLTGAESPAGRWRVRNVVTWCRPNPPVGALGDKWRPATSDVVVACVSDKRYWDDIATRRPHTRPDEKMVRRGVQNSAVGDPKLGARIGDYDAAAQSPAGAPLLDYWEIPPGGYKGAHYAVFPPALVEPLVKAMAPPKVCRTCGEPSRRIVETERLGEGNGANPWDAVSKTGGPWHSGLATQQNTLGWSDCSHDDWRPALILDPFAGSGTTLSVATGHGHDAIGIDLDPRNADLARDRIGPFLFDETLAVPPKEKT